MVVAEIFARIYFKLYTAFEGDDFTRPLVVSYKIYSFEDK